LTQAIRLELRPSRWLIGGLVMLHAASFAAAFVSLSSWILLLVAAGVAMSAVVTTRSALLNLPDSVRGLEFTGDRNVRWRGNDGNVHEAILAEEGLVCSWLVILALDPVDPGAASHTVRRWIVLAQDSANQEVLRQLRVWLRARDGLGSPPDNHAVG
jgi:hypothetical protein